MDNALTYHPAHLTAALVNAIDEHIAVLDEQGVIIYVNQAWCQFAGACQASAEADQWLALNYVTECRRAAKQGDEFSLRMLAGLMSVQLGNRGYYLEYPFFSGHERKWYSLRVAPLLIDGRRFLVLSRQDITRRKLAEEAACRAAQTDALTGIYNRSCGEQRLAEEFIRSRLHHLPLAFALVSIDHLKAINDHHGHLMGDRVLLVVAQLIEAFCKGAGDCCYRLGGDKLCIVWPNTRSEKAYAYAQTLRLDAEQLTLIDHQGLAIPIHLSIGVAALLPEQDRVVDQLVRRAGLALHRVKNAGRHGVFLSA